MNTVLIRKRAIALLIGTPWVLMASVDPNAPAEQQHQMSIHNEVRTLEDHGSDILGALALAEQALQGQDFQLVWGEAVREVLLPLHSNRVAPTPRLQEERDERLGALARALLDQVNASLDTLWASSRWRNHGCNCHFFANARILADRLLKERIRAFSPEGFSPDPSPEDGAAE